MFWPQDPPEHPRKKGARLRVPSFQKARTLLPQGAGARRAATQIHGLPVCPHTELGDQRLKAGLLLGAPRAEYGGRAAQAWAQPPTSREMPQHRPLVVPNKLRPRGAVEVL